MDDNPKIRALQARMNSNVYIRHWNTGLDKTCMQRPGYCCYALFCGWCASYELRKQALHGDMRRYICCNGACPCSGRCGESSNPECCLAMEVFFCFAQSVASTRFMIQDEMRLQTTQCDNCIIGTMIALQYISCICNIVACITGSEEVAQLANLIDCLADIAWYTVCACMQTQHKIEMDLRDANPGSIPPPIPNLPPGIQTIPMGTAPPPGGGYPPPPGYGYPQGGYPPAPPAGYPQAYPPAYQYPPPPQIPGAPPPQPGMYRP